MTRVAPLAGVNTISHAGMFSPPFPLPDALKLAQSKVADPHVPVAATVLVAVAVAVAVAVTVGAPPLPAKIASIAIASGMAGSERRIARRIRTPIAAGSVPGAML
jgi:hypothetical protein